MKKNILGLLVLLVLILAAPLAAQADPEAPPFVIDEAVIAAILGLGGIGLAYVANFLKLAIKLQGKAAVILVLVLSIAATAGTLLITHTFGWLPLLFYSAAVFGEMTGWYKLGPGMKKATI